MEQESLEAQRGLLRMQQRHVQSVVLVLLDE
jgi:hypothetical protein